MSPVSEEAVSFYLLKEARIKGAQKPVFFDCQDGELVILDKSTKQAWRIKVEEIL